MAYDFRLAQDEKREVLRIARATVTEFLRSGRVPPGRPHRRSLLAGAGAFVTLRTTSGQLRGCIGTQFETDPLYRTVQEMSIASATRDPRFPPVTSEELDGLVIEVSVLGDRAIVRSPDDIRIGEHGLAIHHGGQRGLLLPQVASEGGWSPEEFLRRLASKAQLPADSWRDGDAVIERFTAQVFDEKEYPPLDPQDLFEELRRGG